MRRTRVPSFELLPAGLAVVAAVALLAPRPAAAQGAPNGFMDEFDGQFGASASKLVALARAMPAESFDWSPMEGTASVAEVFMHIARYNYYYPEIAMDVPSPMGAEVYDRWQGTVNDKEQVVEILAESMEHVRRVARGMTPTRLDRTTRLYGRNVGEWAVLLQLVTHMNEHLGQSIAYARSNGVAPPWSG